MKQKDASYFDMFVSSIEFTCKAASMLEELMNNYTDVANKVYAIHQVEHKADIEHHVLIDTLNRAFITPIDREDIMTMAHSIDNITDKIEDISYQFEIYSIKAIRPDMLELAKLITASCLRVKDALIELKNFKKSKTLHNHIVEINNMEEAGDKQFKKSIKDLFSTCTDARELIAWNEIYITVEKCIDLCEDVADEIGNIIMKNN